MATVDSIDLLVSFDPNEGCAQALEDALKRLREASLKDEGCVHYRLGKSNIPFPRFFLQERWRDDQALELHKCQAHFLSSFKRIQSLSAGIVIHQLEWTDEPLDNGR